MKGLVFSFMLWFILLLIQGFKISICFDKNMWATRYSRTMMGKMLLEHLEEQRETSHDLSQVFNPLLPRISEGSSFGIKLRKTIKEIVFGQLRHEWWYICNVSKFQEHIASKFIQFNLDEESEHFLANCQEKGNYVFTQMAHVALKGILSFFMSLTTVNGILNRGSMFVFSKSQFQQLLHIDDIWKASSLLDLGSGDGRVTSIMDNHFNMIYVTEQSPSMRWRLRKLNYNVLEIDEWTAGTYDVISCLNLLDRCDKPLTLLSDIRKALNPNGGRLVVAVVLPFSPCVESGSKITKPTEEIPLRGKEWEEQATSLINDVFHPAGFHLESFTRLPYLCEGDVYRDFYVLSDAVFVLRPTIDL